MKIQLPIIGRYVLPVLLLVLAVDTLWLCVLAVAITIKSAADRTHRVDTAEGFHCLAYTSKVLGDVYVFARCAKP